MTAPVQYPLNGLRDVPLGSYLGAIGLFKVVATQADAQATLRWAGDVPHLCTTVTDLPEWLHTTYCPTVVLNPWNKGGGYGPKDKTQRVVLDKLLGLDDPGLPQPRKGRTGIVRDDPRLQHWREAHAVIAPLAARYWEEDWPKERLVRELRNRAPESFLDWIDAAVVLTQDKVVFPGLLGTGGNDGRFDFSTNFHQRLQDVLPETRRKVSMRWAQALLDNESVPLRRASVGQFDPAAAGFQNSSAFGRSHSLVNPWGLVLTVEGASALTSGAVQRLHEGGRAAMPFTVDSTPHGGGSGSVQEKSRGEFWAPRWSAALTWPEIAHLLREGRAAWDGRSATSAVHMYEAARSFGLSRGVDCFTRYGLPNRNGTSVVAVPISRVQVREDPLVHALLPVERWIDSSRAANSETRRNTAAAYRWRAADGAHVRYVQTGDAGRLLDLLVESTRLRIVVGNSTELRGTIWPPAELPSADSVSDILNTVLTDNPEARLARALVTARLAPDEADTTLARLILPATAGRQWEQWGKTTTVAGLGFRPLAGVLADVAVWCARRQASSRPGAGTSVTGIRLAHPTNVRAPWPDLHAWVAGRLDDAQLQRFLLAFLALDWRCCSTLSTPRTTLPAVPDPTLALLSPFSAGLNGADDTVLGVDPTWALRLRSGKEPVVVREARHRLARAGWRASEPVAHHNAQRGLRLATALLVPTYSYGALKAVAGEPEET